MTVQTFVTYELFCVICNNNYIGQTTSNLGKRIAEHMSEYTGKDAKKTPTAVSKHHKEEQHPVQPSNFKIIGRAPNKFQLGLLEAIQIAHFKPIMNKQVQAAKLYTV